MSNTTEMKGESIKMVNIKGLDKAKVLQKLHEKSHAQGMSFLHDKGAITLDRANELVQGQDYFDYVDGRVIKVDLSEDAFNPYLYDRDCGEGAAARAIDDLK